VRFRQLFASVSLDSGGVLLKHSPRASRWISRVLLIREGKKRKEGWGQEQERANRKRKLPQ